MATIVSGPSEKQKAIFKKHGMNLDGSPVAVKTTGGSGGKGGAKPNYDLTDPKQREGFMEARAKYNNDNSYGYYNNQGQYVDFLTDATDGGGMNTTGTYFQGGGPISTLLNVAKIRPAGMSRETNDAGQYVVPRADIGFRDIADMTDRGGPQAMGGAYQGGPAFVSNIFNALDQIGGVDQGERVTYASMTPQELERRRAARGY